jgi:ATP-dependent Lhr-like helicase
MPSSSAFVLSRLDERIQRWIEAEGWSDLRPFQIDTMASILDSSSDVLISAPTASGKTEAALLPLVSICLERPAPGIRILYVIPLKALANDLDRRIESISERTGLPVHRWHGDVSQSRKMKLGDNPSGVLLVTPESLEAMFVNRPHRLADFFDGLEAAVIDEVHAYVGTERGAQLRSLLARLELLLGRRVRRIGLSATVGDLQETAAFLQSVDATAVELIQGGKHREVEVRVRTFDPADGERLSDAADAILMATDSNSAVFCNSRAAVEFWTVRLSDRATSRFVGAHHGSLSKEHRESVERELRSGTRPATVVATSTLELGLDIGALAYVAQVGPPPSVAALHQRAGRAGRREASSLTDVILLSAQADAESSLEECLQTDVLQAIAAVELQREGWCEAPVTSALHLSTAVQQIVSMICERGGCAEDWLFQALCVDGSFWMVSREVFRDVIEDLIERSVLVRAMDDSAFLRLGDEGERLISHYKFFAAFSTPTEYRVVAENGCIGTVVPAKSLKPGAPLLFAGRRWRITAVSHAAKLVQVVASGGDHPPRFPGSLIPVANEVVRRMLDLYQREDLPSFGDSLTLLRLREARCHFQAAGLTEQRILANPNGATLFPWLGTHAMTTLQLCLVHGGLKVERSFLSLEVSCESVDQLFSHLGRIAAEPPTTSDLLSMLEGVGDFEKHHRYIRHELVALDYISQRIDVPAAVEAATNLHDAIAAARPVVATGFKAISASSQSLASPI